MPEQTLSYTEEHYLKALYLLQKRMQGPIPLKAMAAELDLALSTTSSMLKRLAEKGLVRYEPYAGSQLQPAGRRAALRTLRNQRLWEVFLVQKLNMSWDEVHAATEELEHVRSEKVMQRLEAFLGHPTVDPHGDPIPSATGEVQAAPRIPLHEAQLGTAVTVMGVTLTEPDFLRQLDHLGIGIGARLTPTERLPYDGSLVVELEDGLRHALSPAITQHVLVA